MAGKKTGVSSDGFTLVCLTWGKGTLSLALVLKEHWPERECSGSRQGREMMQVVFGSSGS